MTTSVRANPRGVRGSSLRLHRKTAQGDEPGSEREGEADSDLRERSRDRIAIFVVGSLAPLFNTLSSATADRLLRPQRQQVRGISTTKPGALLKHQVPIRTFADWNDVRPGFLEAVCFMSRSRGHGRTGQSVYCDQSRGPCQWPSSVFLVARMAQVAEKGRLGRAGGA